MADEHPGGAPEPERDADEPALDPNAPLFRRSHPYHAFALMTLPFFVLVGIVALPFIGWVLLLVLLPIEFRRIGGRPIARSDALWVAVPAGPREGRRSRSAALRASRTSST